MSLYTPAYVASLIRSLEQRQYNTWQYIIWYIKTNDFSVPSARKIPIQTRGKYLYIFTVLTAILGITTGVTLIAGAIEHMYPEGFIFGIATFVALPVICSIALVIYNSLISLLVALNLKNIGKRAICVLLEAQVVRLRKKYPFTVVAVVGSVGKTSTKLAVAQTLELTGKRVRYQQGNYNDRLTVPLVVFDQPLPHLFNVLAWFRVLRRNRKIIRTGYDYDVVVLELGTDGPRQIKKFAYLMPDITVVTAIAQEHMEFFGTIDAVAKEELSLAPYSKQMLINTDDSAEKYRKGITYKGYGLLEKHNDYYIEAKSETIHGQQVRGLFQGKEFAQGTIAFLGPQGRKIILAAAAVADMLDVSTGDISTAIVQLKPFAGRMQIVPGIKNSTLIDDTYNATPAAVEAALHVLTNTKAPQRVAVLGSMNELGDYTVEAHKTIGTSIDPQKISLVVTIGAVARDYLAPAAQEQGCEVQSFLNPHEAGLYVKKHIAEKALILFKGSQNGVFSEEALKPLLAEKSDETKLVRQSSYWMKQKCKQFTLPR